MASLNRVRNRIWKKSFLETLPERGSGLPLIILLLYLQLPSSDSGDSSPFQGPVAAAQHHAIGPLTRLLALTHQLLAENEGQQGQCS